MRILITGAIGAGKSCLANRILQAYAAQVRGLRSLRNYDGQGQQSFSLQTLNRGENWPLDTDSPQTDLFEHQVLPGLQRELQNIKETDFVLIDEVGKMESAATSYLDFIQSIQAGRQIMVVRKECLFAYRISCSLLLDLDMLGDEAAFQLALSLLGPPPQRDQTRLILMASGFSRRFRKGEDKLMTLFQGKPLVEHALALCSQWQRDNPEALVLVCAREEAVLRLSHQYGLIGLFNKEAEEGISASIRLGLAFEPGYPVKNQQFIFLPADQPHLHLSTLQALCASGDYQREALVSLIDDQGKPGSPVLFGSDYAKELYALTGDQGGRRVFAKYPEKQRFLKAEALELKDYDQFFE